MKNWTTHHGRLDIGMPSSARTDEQPVFSFELTDAVSGARILELEISPADLAMGMNGRGYREVTFAINPLAQTVIGAVHETKTVPIFVPDAPHIMDVEQKRDDPTAAPLLQAVAPYERDGWVARLSDLQNGHRRVERDTLTAGAQAQLRDAAGFSDDARGRFQQVSFHRYVKDGVPVEWPR